MVKLRQKNNYIDVSYKKFKERGSGSDSGEETELFVRNKPQKLTFVEKVIEEGDTLLTLAIKYRCSVAELKRINNIHNENEIFARSVIKVPHRPFTLALAGVHISGSSSPEPCSNPSTSQLIDIESITTKLSENINSFTKKDEVNEIIFNSQITQIPNEVIDENEGDEEVNLLPQNNGKVIENDPIISRLSCNGADADISWKLLLVCVILIVALPLIYVFYIAEHPESYHHHHGS